MELGISTASFFGKIDITDVFDFYRKTGIKTAEVFLNTYSEYRQPFVVPLSEKKGDIKVHSVHSLGTQFEPQLFSHSARVREDAEGIFADVLGAAQTLGGKFYTFHGPMMLKKHAYNFDYAGLSSVMNHVSEFAAKYGVKVSYENVCWTYFSFPEYFVPFMEKCPNLYATLDIKQAVMSEHSVFSYLDIMKDRLSTIHICDTVGFETALPGKGTFDFRTFFERLKTLNVDVPIIMEVYSKDYQEIGEVEESLDYIRNLMRETGLM